MLLTTIFALGLQAATPPVWVEFYRDRSGFAHTPYRYEARSVRRRGHYVRVRYGYTVFASGFADWGFRVGVEVDCVRRTARNYSTRIEGGEFVDGRLAVRLLPAETRARPIVPDGPEHILASRLCPDPSATEN